jgi:hypothetical protein
VAKFQKPQISMLQPIQPAFVRPRLPVSPVSTPLPTAGTDNMDWVTDSNPKKVTARKMVEMVVAINRQNFAGAQMVTCC